MAFDRKGLTMVHQGAALAAGSVRRLWHYVTNDTKAVVETDGYFDSEDEVMATGDAIIVIYDIDGTMSGRIYAVTKATGDIALTGVTADQAALGGIAPLTENSGAIGGTNDGDLPALTGSPAGTDAAIITALIAAVREIAAKQNVLLAAL
jgi:hypothetical protein